MEGFENLGSSTNSADSKLAKLKRLLSGNKKTRIILIAVLILLIVSIFTIILPAQKTYSSVKKTTAQAKAAIDALKKQNVALAQAELKKTREDLKETQKKLGSLAFTKFIPVLGGYYNDADHLIKAGFHGLDAADTLVASIAPYADVLGLKGQGSFVGGTASQRVETAVKTMGKVTPKIDEIAADLTKAKEEVDNVNPNDYHPFLGLGKAKKELASLRKLTDEGVTFINDARPLIKILPNLLGEPKEKKYLILFQNDKELRPTGGFLTAYSIFRLERGVIHVESSSDIYELDARVPNKARAPRPIAEYLPKVPLFNLRDSNLSPDFVVSMETFRGMYEKARATKVDGIIALDTHILVSTIKILGDEVYAGGIRFTSKEDPRCGGCPQVIYELERLVSTPKSVDLKVTTLASVQAQRKDIVGVLLYAIMNKAFSSSPKLYWGPLFQEMINQTAQKHILFYVFDKNAQAGLEALNAAGRIVPYEGDYLAINQANFGGAKSNMFVEEAVSQNYEVKSDGTIVKTVTINYKNPHPPSDCNLERGGLCLNAVLRDWVRVYVPKGSRLINSQGSEVKLISYDELGKTVFEGFLTVRPKGIAAFTISYSLPFKLAKDSPLPLLIQKQPGTPGFEHTITVNGVKKETFPLLTDKTLKLNI